MSARTEIEAYRQQIETARVEEEDRIKLKYPKISELPPGVFNNEQLRRWRIAEFMISDGVRKFLADLEIVNFKLETDFSYTNKNSKRVDFVLKFREGKVKEEWEEDKPYQVVLFHYDPGGRFTDEHIGSYWIHLAVPRKKKGSSWFEVDEAIQWINNPKVNTYHFASVDSFSVNKEQVQNLLKLLLANPATINPEPKKAVVGR